MTRLLGPKPSPHLNILQSSSSLLQKPPQNPPIPKMALISQLTFTFSISITPFLHFRTSKLTPPFKPLSITASASSSAAKAVSEAAANNTLPCIRTYETDLARLSLTGLSPLQLSLTAAAADGGFAAQQHIDSGLDVMVVSALFPGSIDDRSTVSTQLFLPPRKVKEKARKLRSSFPKDIFSGTSSENILAMTFRQVLLQQLLSFDLTVFVPGSRRNVEDLETEREVTVSFALSSSDGSFLSSLAEAVCLLALEFTQMEFQNGSRGKVPFSFFNWFSKTKKYASKDSSVILYKFDDEVIVENAKSLLDMFKSSQASYAEGSTNPKISTWASAMHSKLEKIGGFEFSKWTSEHVPVYRLEINGNRLINTTFEGWKRTSGNNWEVLLTHSQMVALADVLDMYFEDVYTLPSKQLSCDVVRSSKNLLQNKTRFSLWSFARSTLALAIAFVSVGVMSKQFLPPLNISVRSNGDVDEISSAEDGCEKVHSVILEAFQLEAYCCALVTKLKDGYGWNGDVKFDPSVGAWIGEFPTSLRNGHIADPVGKDVSTSSDMLAASDDMVESSIEEIASYQVVMSTDGVVVGFQPTSRVAVNQWASNPIANELYGGKKLSPGLLEPRLNIKKPDDVIVMELLISQTQDNCFALARLAQ